MEKIRIQDDLYNYVNQEWIEQAVIPNDRPSCGGFDDLAVGVEKIMMGEFAKMCAKDEYPNDYLKRACDLYKIALNVKKRNKEGIKPVLKDLAKIEKLKNISALNRNLKDFVIGGCPLPFEIFVETNMKDAVHHIVYIAGPRTILPDTTYYQEPLAAQGQQILGFWANMVKTLLAYTKLTPEDQAKYLEDAIKFDAIIATLVKSSEEQSEYTKLYNPITVRKANSSLKPIKFTKLLENLFGFVPEMVSAADPRFLKGFKTLFNEENFELYKHWAYIKVLIGASTYLSEDLRNIGSSYYRALTGIAEMSALDKFAYNLASDVYSEPIGLYYGEKYFGEEAKKDVVEMVQEIIETYKARIRRNEFLQDATKEKAIIKLDKMPIKMGYPDKVNPKFEKLVFDPTKSLYAVVSEIGKIRKLDELDKINRELDRTEWAMPGHMVNACYNPFTNDITFPAAILQAPFYSIKQSRSQNLGGIGVVIGHEISHAFDNNGAKCDENGNLFNWWTKEDNKNFNNKTKAMIKQFEGIVLPWGPVNAKLIVSENIADNGGMATSLEIMSHMKDANYEEYFTNWAKVWCVKAKPEYQQILLSVDVHGPAILRANIPPRNFPEWYETFKVTKKDQMYIAPSKRLVIW